MPTFDVTILTDSRYINPTDKSEYVNNILNEDSIVAKALEKAGLNVTRKDWADPEFNWNDTGSVVFRTTWDYFDRFDEFKLWLESTSKKTRFINSPNIINWNVDKHYLQSLVAKGVRTVPTRFIPRNSATSLSNFIHMTGWKTAVIKPTIGGAARHTYKVTEDNIDDISTILTPIMEVEDFMIQPFQYSVPTQGEWSFIMFGEQYSHAVLKKAKAGDFRVQDDFGGTVAHHEATQEEKDFALNVVRACPEEPAYSRIDVIRDNDGLLAVSELELIEPELWFRFKPEAADLLTNEVLKRLR